MLNVLLFLVLRLAGWLMKVTPAAVMYRLALLAGWWAFYLVRGARRGVTTNLAVVMNAGPGSREVKLAARRAFQNDALNWVDTLRIGRLSTNEIRAMVQVNDWPLLERSVASGRGVILVTLHLGNFDFVGQVLASHGYRLTVPVERMEPTELFEFLVEQRTKNGIVLVPVEHAARELLRALRAGELVGLAGDRNIAGKTVQIPVFGKPASMPIGPVSLARRTGSPLLLAVGIRERPGRFRGVMHLVPIRVSGDAAADDAGNLASFVRLMEEVVAEYPAQWLAFKPFWEVDADENTAATMGHQKRAAV